MAGTGSTHFSKPAPFLSPEEALLMSTHVAISPEESADRLAIRELVETYAHCADRRDAKGQMSLFTEDTHFVVYMNAKDPTPSQELHSRGALAPVFAELNKYDATTHFIGQSGKTTQIVTLADIDRFGRQTLALDQEDELLQLAFVEVGDSAERHP
jgi:hypothetical protein